jgi:endo-1,4-beta-xylanase
MSIDRVALSLSLLLAALCFPMSVHAADSAATSAQNLIDYQKWTAVGSPQSISMSVVLESGPDNRQHHVLHVVVSQPSEPFYYLQVTQPLSQAVPAEHRLRYSFWAKATNANLVRACIELDRPPYTAYVNTSVSLTSDWRQYSATDTSPGIPSGTAAVRLQVGKSAGTIEFADVTVEDLGVDPDLVVAEAAIQPQAIKARIRKYRMADLNVRVLDGWGRPVPNATVSVEQTAHAFLFGCNVFGLSQSDQSPILQQEYRREFAALFNYATLPFYWNGFEPTEGDEQFPRLKWMAQWCAEHGIQTKAHPLVWHQSYPSWAPEDVDATIPLLHRRVTDIVAQMSPTTKYFDVVNEASSGAAGQTPPVGESNWVNRDGAAKVVETALSWARQAGQGQNDTFIDNDYDIGENNVDMLQQMQRDGKLPDAIGIQSHMHSGVWPLTKVWMVCDRFAQFNRPIHFTETTVLSTNAPHAVDSNAPPATDWLTTPDGEQSQAAYVTQFYTVLFSHPSLRAITWWDFSDRNSWMGAPSGLVRSDMSTKPAYTALMDLIHKQWWTSSSGRSNNEGLYRVHAFYGSYTITVEGPAGESVTQSATMPEASGPTTVTIHLK